MGPKGCSETSLGNFNVSIEILCQFCWPSSKKNSDQVWASPEKILRIFRNGHIWKPRVFFDTFKCQFPYYHVAMQAALAVHFSQLEEFGEHAGPGSRGATQPSRAISWLSLILGCYKCHCHSIRGAKWCIILGDFWSNSMLLTTMATLIQLMAPALFPLQGVPNGTCLFFNGRILPAVTCGKEIFWHRHVQTFSDVFSKYIMSYKQTIINGMYWFKCPCVGFSVLQWSCPRHFGVKWWRNWRQAKDFYPMSSLICKPSIPCHHPSMFSLPRHFTTILSTVSQDMLRIAGLKSRWLLAWRRVIGEYLDCSDVEKVVNHHPPILTLNMFFWILPWGTEIYLCSYSSQRASDYSAQDVQDMQDTWSSTNWRRRGFPSTILSSDVSMFHGLDSPKSRVICMNLPADRCGTMWISRWLPAFWRHSASIGHTSWKWRPDFQSQGYTSCRYIDQN